jgi:hypothetical protein
MYNNNTINNTSSLLQLLERTKKYNRHPKLTLAGRKLFYNNRYFGVT